nr:MAG TPA: hypothetical protein [Caudoviricetes sp.]
MDMKGWGRKAPALFHAHNTSRGRARYFHTLMGVHSFEHEEVGHAEAEREARHRQG